MMNVLNQQGWEVINFIVIYFSVSPASLVALVALVACQL